MVLPHTSPQRLVGRRSKDGSLCNQVRLVQGVSSSGTSGASFGCRMKSLLEALRLDPLMSQCCQGELQWAKVLPTVSLQPMPRKSPFPCQCRPAETRRPHWLHWKAMGSWRLEQTKIVNLIVHLSQRCMGHPQDLGLGAIQGCPSQGCPSMALTSLKKSKSPQAMHPRAHHFPQGSRTMTAGLHLASAASPCRLRPNAAKVRRRGEL